MQTRHFIISCLATLALTGCNNTQWQLKPRSTADRFEPRSTTTQESQAIAAGSPRPKSDVASSLQQQPVIVLQIKFDIMRVRVAKGVFSESGKIWNHLDEEAIPAQTAAMLQRNGLRAARGKPDAWRPIQALLEQEKKVETSQDSMIVANGLPLTVEIDRRLRDQTFFLFRQDGTLGGVSCPKSTNLIHIEYSIPLNDPSAVVVDVMPEIRQQQVLAPLTVNTSGQLDQPIEQPTRVLHELGFHMELPAGDFFIVGPSAAAHKGHLAGSLLLCEEIDGKAFESLYCITPRVYRTDRPKTP